METVDMEFVDDAQEQRTEPVFGGVPRGVL